MPLYEYQCNACHHTFEVLQKVSDQSPACPSCGSHKIDKLISKSGFQLKGSGWYATDYKKPTPEPKSEKPVKEDQPEKADTKSVKEDKSLPKTEKASKKADDSG